jgi:hypothetical protein
MIIDVRIPSSTTGTPLASPPSAQHLPTVDSFVLVLGAASLNRPPVKLMAGSAAKEQSGQGRTNRPVTKKPAEESFSVQRDGSSRTWTLRPPDNRKESQAPETSDNQEKSNNKTESPTNSRQSASNATSIPDSSVAIPQTADTNMLNPDLSRGQKEGHSATEQSAAANSKSANEQVLNVGPDASAPVKPQAASNGEPVELNKLPQDLQGSVNPMDTPDPDDSLAPTGTIEMKNLTTGSFASSDGTPLPQPMPFPLVATLAEKQGENEGAGNTSQKMGSSKLTPLSQNDINATNPGSGKTAESTNSPNDASTHSSQGTQAQSTQNLTAAPRVVDMSTTHINALTAANQTISSHTTIAPRLVATPGNASHTGELQEVAPSDPENVSAMASSVIGNARLMQTLNQSEMRIGLSSNGFGDISIRTSISGHELVAQISLDHGELSQVISAQVSSVRARLGNEHGLHASIEINNHAFSQSGDAGSSSQRERGSPTAPLPSSSAVALADEGNTLNQETILNAAIENRLDIRA